MSFKSYIGNVFVSIDQLGNVLAGGNPDNTISARIGYHSYHNDKVKNRRSYWHLFRGIVDFTFYPIDGPEHCHNAFHNDAGEIFDNDTKDWAVILLSILIILSCIPIATFLHLFWLFGVVSPKTIYRVKNMTLRMKGAGAKLKGISNELDEFPIDEDPKPLKEELRETRKKILIVSKKINALNKKSEIQKPE